MEVKNPGSKNNDQNSLQAKELQKFFNKVEGVMLIPKNAELQRLEYSILGLLLNKETFVNFKDYGINKIVVDLLDDKFPILSINTQRENSLVGLSITDKDSGLTFKLPDQTAGEPLLKFLQATKYDDKIPVMLGYFNGDTIHFDNNVTSNVLLVLDGYMFE